MTNFTTNDNYCNDKCSKFISIKGLTFLIIWFHKLFILVYNYFQCDLFMLPFYTHTTKQI